MPLKTPDLSSHHQVWKPTRSRFPPSFENRHKNVKTIHGGLRVTSKFEVAAGIIVIAKAGNRMVMANSIPLRNIEDEEKSDRETVEQISKIIRFLWNIED